MRPDAHALTDTLRRAIEPVVQACPARVDVTPADVRDDGLATRVPEGAAVVCLGLLDDVTAVAALVEALVAAARDRGATVILEVPNDLLGQPGPTVWGEGALEELRAIVPPDHVAAPIIELRGSLVLRGDEMPETVPITGGGSLRPAGWLLAFGPHAGLIAGASGAVAIDTLERRRERRALDSELAYLRARLGEGRVRELPAGAP